MNAGAGTASPAVHEAESTTLVETDVRATGVPAGMPGEGLSGKADGRGSAFLEQKSSCI